MRCNAIAMESDDEMEHITDNTTGNANPRGYEPYQYQPMLPGEIRILTLLPGKLNQPLQGSLTVLSLAAHRPFKAVSYAWGDPSARETLRLRDGSIAITHSLRGALRRFRNDQQPVDLWVDQVCINQRDLSEQGHQVSIMSRIYSQAEEVLAWLGESKPTDVLAFWAVKALAMSLEKGKSLDIYTPKQAQVLLVETLRGEAEKARSTLRCPCCDESIPNGSEGSVRTLDAVQSIRKLMRRPYFDRLWPVQEVALSNAVTYYCGQHHIEFGCLYWIVELLCQTQLCLPTFSIRLGQFSLLENACRVRSSVLETIIETAEFAVSEPRDRIFAIRPLTSETDDALLIPDYTIALDELWRRTALCSLHSKPTSRHSDAHDCLALSLAGYSHDSPSQLRWSWVPDLSVKSINHWKKLRYFVQYSREFCAGGPQSWNINYDSRYPDIVGIPGRLLSAIQVLLPGSEFDFGRLKRSLEHSTQGRWAEIEEVLIPWYLTCYDFVFARTRNLAMSTSDFATFLRQGDTWEGSERPAFEECQELIERALSKHSRRNSDRLLEVNEVYEDLSAFMSYESYRSYSDSQWVLASLEDNRVAWVSGTARVGDLICLYQGAPFPFVVHDRGDGSFANLGDAYVERCMYGEAWPAGDERPGIIVLR